MILKIYQNYVRIIFNTICTDHLRDYLKFHRYPHPGHKHYLRRRHRHLLVQNSVH